MMELLMLDADELLNPQKYQKAMEVVGEARRSKIEKMRKEESKRLSLAAGILLRYAFLSVNQLELYNAIEITENGKPFLPNNEYYFSLSHSGKFAICGFADASIGCDIELVREKLPHTTKIFTDDEEKTFGALDEKEKKLFFFYLWTCKESVTKWIGKGIAFPFHHFSVMTGQQVKKTIVIEEKNLFLGSFQIENYIVSLCAETPELPREIKKMDLNLILEN
ncbi:MAG: 4'-phosphopantetheinyl transferase superfamily protein [Clostridia bacterium]|nr:4'-phosphopantetheinyl transferase superfamily protein [Clostridia bacterium]